jgi:hypothetical protein
VVGVIVANNRVVVVVVAWGCFSLTACVACVVHCPSTPRAPLAFDPARSVSTKILRLFRCEEVEGKYWLSVDIRQQCYTKEWCGAA